MVPDQSIFAAGGNTTGKVLNLAARHQDGRWLMVYLADQATFSIHLSKLASRKLQAVWIDPRTGESKLVGRFGNTGTQSFSTPDGWDDAILVLEESAGRAFVGQASKPARSCVLRFVQARRPALQNSG